MSGREVGEGALGRSGVMPLFCVHSFKLPHMKPTPKTSWNPDRLDVRAFAQASASLNMGNFLTFLDDGPSIELSGSTLPALVVDEEIYRQPPALLIATVDKFAQMPWRGAVQM